MKCTGEHCLKAKNCALYEGNAIDGEVYQVEDFTLDCCNHGKYKMFVPIKTNTLVVDFTNTIYLAEVVPTKDDPNLLTLTGGKVDMTNQALAAVFQWFINNYKENEPTDGFEVRFPNQPYVLKMVKEE